MKFWKKIFAILSLCIVSIGLTACGGSANIDYDLASKGDTFTYTTVTNMQSSPSSYLNKTIKIRGKHKSNGSTYHYLSGYDSTNCCNWSMEIRINDDSLEFPETNKNVVVVGDYKSKKVNGKTSYYLEVIEFV